MRAWIRDLLIGKQHEQLPSTDVDQVRNRVHRLEIALAELRERVDSLEGRHASLSASVRGRLGGRGNKAQHTWPFNQQLS